MKQPHGLRKPGVLTQALVRKKAVEQGFHLEHVLPPIWRKPTCNIFLLHAAQGTLRKEWWWISWYVIVLEKKLKLESDSHSSHCPHGMICLSLPISAYSLFATEWNARYLTSSWSSIQCSHGLQANSFCWVLHIDMLIIRGILLLRR